MIGNGGAASAITFACTEGNFGGNVYASICGNYTFGANDLNESTTSWGPGTAASRTIGGNDIPAGPQQSIAALNGMSIISWVGLRLVLTNRSCTTSATSCNGTTSFNSGYQYTFRHGTLIELESEIPVPAAVWLFGSALGVMGLMRRKSVT